MKAYLILLVSAALISCSRPKVPALVDVPAAAEPTLREFEHASFHLQPVEPSTGALPVEVVGVTSDAPAAQAVRVLAEQKRAESERHLARLEDERRAAVTRQILAEADAKLREQRQQAEQERQRQVALAQAAAAEAEAKARAAESMRLAALSAQIEANLRFEENRMERRALELMEESVAEQRALREQLRQKEIDDRTFIEAMEARRRNVPYIINSGSSQRVFSR